MDNQFLSDDTPLTGDAVIFLANTSTGFLLRTLTSSGWNHSGIAVRILSDGTISLNEKGKLYILEVNTWERSDPITGQTVAGAGYSDFEWVKQRYNVIAIRPLKDKYRVPKFLELMEQFMKKYHGFTYTDRIGPFFSAWVGVPFHSVMDESVPEAKQLFCSEFMGLFYDQCVGTLMPSIDGIDYSGEFTELLGEGAPHLPMLCSPHHFSYSYTPKSQIFKPRDVIVYTTPADLLSCIIPVLIITFFIAALVWCSFC